MYLHANYMCSCVLTLSVKFDTSETGAYVVSFVSIILHVNDVISPLRAGRPYQCNVLGRVLH